MRYDQAQCMFRSAGTSLNVVMDAFRDDGSIVWFSREYGDIHHSRYENLMLFAVEKSELPHISGCLPGTFTPEKYDRLEGPLNLALQGEGLSFEEFRFSEADLAFFGIDWDLEKRQIPPIFSYAIHLHDDCFATVEPIYAEDDKLRDLVLSHLKLHSHYLQQDVVWDDVLSAIAELLTTDRDVTIESQPNEQKVLVARHDRAGMPRHLQIAGCRLIVTIRDGRAFIESAGIPS